MKKRTMERTSYIKQIMQTNLQNLGLHSWVEQVREKHKKIVVCVCVCVFVCVCVRACVFVVVYKGVLFVSHIDTDLQ